MAQPELQVPQEMMALQALLAQQAQAGKTERTGSQALLVLQEMMERTA